MAGDDGFRFVGHPKDFDWSLFEGNTVLSHNASFDESLYLYGAEQGWYPSVAYKEWHCTADMCAYLGLPRSLKDASAAALNEQVSKDTRDAMEGKTRAEMSPEFLAEVDAYAIKDAELCLRLWQELNHKWPLHEREISRVNRKVGQRGLPIDPQLLKTNLEVIKVKLFDAEQSIPWIDSATALSRKAFNEQCRKQGIRPPTSLAQDSEEADAWFEEHQHDAPWARSVQQFRRINAFLKKLESFDNGLMPDGRYYGGLMYCGANPTARFSGSGGNLNLQNLPREEMFGVNFRHMIKPRDGYKLIVADLSQIEVRTLFWWAEDKQALDMIRTSDDIYHAIAIMLGMHKEEDGPLRNNKALRQKVKAMALGCQFGLGGNGFAAYSGMPLDEAEAAVETYRQRMKSVVKFWASLKHDIEMSSSLGQELAIELPSGRTMKYGTPRRMKTKGSDGKDRFSFVGKMVRNGQRRDFRLWHGLLAENSAQGLARDIFSDMMLRVDAAGIPIILHVHDEMVCEVPEDRAEESLAKILEIMSTPPSWIPDIPVAAEAHILDLYSK